MKKIEKLTGDQEQSLAAFREKWLAIGLSTESANRPEAEKAIDLAYKLAGLPAPGIKIWLGSPFAGCICATLFCELQKRGAPAGLAQVGAQVGAQVWARVRDQVRDQVGAQVRDQVRDQVLAQVRDQVGAQVGAQVEDRVRAQVGAQVWAQVGAQVGAQVWAAVYGSQEAAWLGFYDFFLSHFGLAGKAAGLMSVARHCGWWWPSSGAVIITERPSAMRLDAARRLHAEAGPALVYPDGWCFYVWHGVRIPGEWIENKDKVDPGLALTHENIEQRTALAQILGWDRVLSQLSPRVVDKDELHIGELLEVDLPDAPGSKFLRVRGPGAHGPEGSYVLGVPRETKTARDGNAWTYGMQTFVDGPRT